MGMGHHRRLTEIWSVPRLLTRLAFRRVRALITAPPSQSNPQPQHQNLLIVNCNNRYLAGGLRLQCQSETSWLPFLPPESGRRQTTTSPIFPHPTRWQRAVQCPPSQPQQHLPKQQVFERPRHPHLFLRLLRL